MKIVLFLLAVLVLLWLLRSSARRALALLGAGVIALAVIYPGELRVHSGSPWAPLHWLFGIVSYGLFGVAVLHAIWLNRADRQMQIGRASCRERVYSSV